MGTAMGWGWDRVYVPNRGPTAGLGHPWEAQRWLVPLIPVSCSSPRPCAPKSSPSQNSVSALLPLFTLSAPPALQGCCWGALERGTDPRLGPPTPLLLLPE